MNTSKIVIFLTTSTFLDLYLFLNTHKVTWKKFENEITKIIKPLGLERVRRLSPSEDFKKLPGFIEGDYLKGLLLKKL